MTDLRIGMVGCGLIARSHATGLGRADRAAIVAVHDDDRTRAEALAETFSPLGRQAVMAGPDEVLAAVDALYVCTWTAAHRPVVEAAASAGLPVFCEKPLATTMADAEAMTAAVVASGKTNQVGLVLRHSPAFRWLQHQVNRPELGPIMNIVFRDDQYLPTQGLYDSTWRGDVALAGGGALIEHSIHDLDLLEWMLGPVASVSASVGYVHDLAGIDDQVSVQLTGASGAQASLVSVWHDVLTRPSQRRVEVFTRRGYFSVEGDWNGPVTYDLAEHDGGPAERGSLAGDELRAAAERLDGLVIGADEAFVDAVLRGDPAYPDFATALAAHRLADAAYRSAAAAGVPIETPPLSG